MTMMPAEALERSQGGQRRRDSGVLLAQGLQFMHRTLGDSATRQDVAPAIAITSDDAAERPKARADPFEKKLAAVDMPPPARDVRRKGRRRRATVDSSAQNGLDALQRQRAMGGPTQGEGKAASSKEAAHQPYKVLRSLPGYSPGDALDKKEHILCCSREATAFAMNKLQPTDCAFILRSDGSWTYAIYEGRVDGDNNTLSFKVDGAGHFKLIQAKHFVTKVKVPVLPVALVGTALDVYSKHEEERRKEAAIETEGKDKEKTMDEAVGEAAETLKWSTRRHRKSHRNSTMSITEESSDDEDEEEGGRNAEEDVDACDVESLQEKLMGANDQAEARPIRKSSSMGNLSRVRGSNGWESFPSYSQWTEPNESTSSGLDTGRDALATSNNLTHDSAPEEDISRLQAELSEKMASIADIESKLKSSLRIAAPESSILGRHLGRSGSSSSGLGSRQSSRQDLRHKTASLESVPEAGSIRLSRNITSPSLSAAIGQGILGQLSMQRPNNQNQAFALKRNNASMPSIPDGGLPANAAAGTRRGTSAGEMPRNVTLRRLDSGVGGGLSGGGSANASWEVAGTSSAAPMEKKANPLLEFMAKAKTMPPKSMNVPGMNAGPVRKGGMSSANPLLAAMAAKPQAPPSPFSSRQELARPNPLLEALSKPATLPQATVPGEVTVARENGLLKFAGSGPLVMSVSSTSRAPVASGEAPSDPIEAPSRHGPSSTPQQPAPHGLRVGDRVSQADMRASPVDEMKTALLVSKLRVGDPAFVNRSDGSYTFAVVAERSLLSITFEVDANRGRKSFDLLNVGSYVRVVGEGEIAEMERRMGMRKRTDAVGAESNAGETSAERTGEGEGDGQPKSRRNRPPYVTRETWYETDEKEASSEVKESAGGNESLDQPKEGNGENAGEEKKDDCVNEKLEAGKEVQAFIMRRKCASAGQLNSLQKLSHRPRPNSEWQDPKSSILKNNLAKPKEARLPMRRRSSGYSVGDRVDVQDMPAASTELERARLVSKLRVGDSVFINRTDGSFSHAAVTAKNLLSITFQVTAEGATKTIDLMNAGRYVRILDDKEITDTRRRVGTRNQADADRLSYDRSRSATTPLAGMAPASNVSPQGPSAIRNTFQRVEGKIEDAGTKNAPPTYKKGMNVYYKKMSEAAVPVLILDAHLDDELVPFYTIKFEDGREKQTDNDHLAVEP